MLMTVLCERPSRVVRCSKYIGRASGRASGPLAFTSTIPSAANRAQAHMACHICRRMTKDLLSGSGANFALVEVATPCVAATPRIAATPCVTTAPRVSIAPGVTIAPGEIARIRIAAIPEQPIERRSEACDETGYNAEQSA